MDTIAVNRRAYFDYEILETYEAGIELYGFEVKAVKTGYINLTGSYAVINPVRNRARAHAPGGPPGRAVSNGVKNNEAWLLNATISPYQPKNIRIEYDPLRSRRLLMHKSEIKELVGKSSRQGLTIVPLKVYTKRNRVKILIGLARHKKSGDKREAIKKRDTEREIRRTLKV